MNIERMEKILSMQLEWIKNADSKVPPLFAVNIAMLGVVSALIRTSSTWSCITSVCLALCLLFQIVGVILLVATIFPRTTGPSGSNIYFGGILEKAKGEYNSEVMGWRDEDYMSDLIAQVYRNAQIADTKYRSVKYAFLATFLGVPFWAWSVYLLCI